jgi:hypothetical protein
VGAFAALSRYDVNVTSVIDNRSGPAASHPDDDLFADQTRQRLWSDVLRGKVLEPQELVAAL